MLCTLPGLAVNPVTSVFIRATTEERPCDRLRDWSCAIRSQIMPKVTRSWKRQRMDLSLKFPERVQP